MLGRRGERSEGRRVSSGGREKVMKVIPIRAGRAVRIKKAGVARENVGRTEGITESRAQKLLYCIIYNRQHKIRLVSCEPVLLIRTFEQHHVMRDAL